ERRGRPLPGIAPQVVIEDDAVAEEDARREQSAQAVEHLISPCLRGGELRAVERDPPGQHVGDQDEDRHQQKIGKTGTVDRGTHAELPCAPVLSPQKLFSTAALSCVFLIAWQPALPWVLCFFLHARRAFGLPLSALRRLCYHGNRLSCRRKRW